jgi:hypothetical protein
MAQRVIKEASEASNTLVAAQQKLIDIDLKTAKAASEAASKIREKNKATSEGVNIATEIGPTTTYADTNLGGAASGTRVSSAEVAATEEQLAAMRELNIEQNKSTSNRVKDNAASGEAIGESEALAKAKARLGQAESAENVEIQKHVILSKEANSIAKQEALSALGLTDAYGLLTAQYNAAQRAAKNLAITNPSSPQAKAAATEALALNTQIQAIDKTVGQSQKNVGNYASGFTKAFSAIRQAAYILPGIGIAGIFNLIFEGIGKALSELELFSTKSSSISDKISESLLKSGGAALKEAADLQTLYAVTQDINQSQEVRLKASKEVVDISIANNKATGENNKLLTDSNGLLKEQPDLINKVSDSLIRQAKTKALLNLIEKAYGELIVAQSGSLKENFEQLSFIDKVLASLQLSSNTYKGIGNALTTTLTKPTEDALEKIKELQSFLAKGLTDKSLSIDAVVKGGGDKTNLKTFNLKADTEDLKEEAALQKKLSEIITLELTTRVTARELAAADERKIINLTASIELANEKDKLNAALSENNITANGRINAQNEYNNKVGIITQKANNELKANELKLNGDLIDIHQSYLGRQKEIDKQDNADTIKAFQEAKDKKIAAILDQQDKSSAALAGGKDYEVENLNRNYARQIAAAGANQEKIKKINEQYARDRVEIEYNASKDILKDQISVAEELIKVNGSSANQEKKLSELKISLSDIETKHIIDNNERQKKSHKETLDDITKAINEIRGLYNQVSNIIGGIIDSNAISQKNALQKQSDGIDKQKAKDIDTANATINNAQEKAAAIATIEARAQVQKDVIAQKQRKIDEEQARFNKAKAIADIIFNTAVAVVKALPNIPLAIAIGALGAIELGVALATPIPKYKHGTKNHPGGYAILGDGGKSELAITPSGNMIQSGAKDELHYLPKGTVVFPDVSKVIDSSFNNSMKRLPHMPVAYNNSNEDVIRELRALQTTIRDKREIHITGNYGSVVALHKHAQNTLKYIEQQLDL